MPDVVLGLFYNKRRDGTCPEAGYQLILCKKFGMAKSNFVLEEVVLLSDYFTQDVELANKINHDWACFYWIGTKAVRI